jgi:hypothetical protein
VKSSLLIAAFALVCSLASQCATPEDRSLETRHDALASVEVDSGLDTQDEWLGRYGGIQLQPNARFVADRSDSCLGPFVHSLGTVVDHGDRIELVVDNGRPMPSAFLRVRWGKRHYLVAVNDAQYFCNAVNAGFEPCHESSAFALLRSGDEKYLAPGRPELPPEFSKLVFTEPIEATVIEVEPTEQRPWRHGIDRWHTQVTLDIGSDRGAWIGMEMWLPDHPDAEYLTIVDLGATTSKAEHIAWRPDKLHPEVGWLASTSAHVH